VLAAFVAVGFVSAQNSSDQSSRDLGLKRELKSSTEPTDKTRSTRPELVLQTGHSLGVTALAFSFDQRLLATGSVDNTIKLWDVSTGQELRTLKGPVNKFGAVAFSRDGKWLAGGGVDGKIHLWDVDSGEDVRDFAGHKLRIMALAFSRDGRLLASGSADSTVKIWELESGRELRTLTGHTGWVTTIEFAPDGASLASGGKDHLLKLWSISTFRELQSFSDHASEVSALAFDDSGGLLVSGDADGSVYVWDVVKRKRLQKLIGHKSGIVALTFSPDARLILSASAGQKAVKSWDRASGKETLSLADTENIDRIATATFSHDGEKLAYTYGDKNISIRNLTGKKQEWPLVSKVSGVYASAFSLDGKWFATGGKDNSVTLWEVDSGRQVFSLQADIGWMTSVAFSPDSRLIATGGLSGQIKIWDVISGRELKTLSGHADSINAVAFSKNGLLVSASNDATLRSWNVENGATLKVFKGHTAEVTSVVISQDGEKLFSGSADKTIRIWKVSSADQLRTIAADSSEVNAIALSPNEQMLAAACRDHTAKIWEVETGKLLRSLTGHSSWVTAVAFAPNSEKLVTGSRDGAIRIWNSTDGTLIKTLTEHNDRINAISVNGDGRWFTSASEDGSVRLWGTRSGELAATLISLRDSSDWLVATPDGLFDGSPNAWHQIAWRFGATTYNIKPVEVFFNEYFYPGLLGYILAGKAPRAANGIEGRDRRQPQVSLSLIGADPAENGKISTKVATVQIEVSEAPSDENHPTGSGARDLRLFRNGSLVRVWHGELKRNAGNRTLIQTTIPVVAGVNNLNAYVFNHDNVKSLDAELEITGDDSLKRKAITYVLAVGLNLYQNSSFNLKYAVPDAQFFARLLEDSLKQVDPQAEARIVQLKDDSATKANLVMALSILAGDAPPATGESSLPLSALKKAQPEDNLIVFFAGHGMAYENSFYVLPFDLGYDRPRARLDEAGLQSIALHSISDRELEEHLERVDAGHIVMVLDSCQSGQALETDEWRRGPMNSKGLAQLAYEKGMFILTASQSYQNALEAKELGHGLLTYALVSQGLEQAKADNKPQDGFVVLREWLDYAADNVPRVHLEHLNRTIGIDRPAATIAPESLQRPRVFYRRELEAQPWVVKNLRRIAKQN
jgi:WD40 repeat protein